MIISVAGTGYVGLSLAVLLSQKHQVFAVDILEEKVTKINNRISPIRDNEIEHFFKDKELNLFATTDAGLAYSKSDIIIIATPTNYNIENNSFDTSNIETVLDVIYNVNKNALVVIKSTIPIGYTTKIREKYKLNIMFSPEFLRESKALYDNLYPSRIIVGCDECNENDKAWEFANLLKDCSLKEDTSVLIMGSKEAEAVKLFANSYLAMRISYFNELDNFARVMNLNTLDIINGICKDPRIGDYYNNPSFGYGGYCLPKDTKQLKANFEHVPEELISAICRSNSTRKKFIAEEIEKTINFDKTRIIGVYRLAMKSNSDNYRQSAILDIISILKVDGYNVIIYDENVNSEILFNCPVVSYDELVESSNIIIANRVDEKIKKYCDKLFSRDVFFRD